MNIWHLVGYSQHTYKYPIRPRAKEKIRFWSNDLSHIGKDQYALDIITTNPLENHLAVWAPQAGRVTALVQNHTTWGADSSYAKYTNYVRVQVTETELYFIAHIKADSCNLSVGDFVEADQLLAQTGANGWMTDVRHLHFMVSRTKLGDNYQSVRVRWDKRQKYASAD